MKRSIICVICALALIFGFVRTTHASSEAQPLTIMSAKPVKGIKLGGKLEIRYQDSEGEEGTFQMYEFETYANAEINDNLSMKAQLSCTTSSTAVNEAWIKYKDLPVLGGSLSAGKFRRQSFAIPMGGGSRVSIDYPLFGRAFTGERHVGVEYTTNFASMGAPIPINLGIGSFNGGQIGDREAGDNAASPVKFVADRSGDTDDNESKETSARLTFEPVKGLTIGGSGLVGKLSQTDLSTLNTALGTSYTDDTKQRFGGELTYKSNQVPLTLKAEYITAETSDFDVDSWYAIGVLNMLNKKMDLYARYCQLSPDIALTASSYTWELDQTTLGVIWHLCKTVQFQAEYELNGETPPAGTEEVDNDIVRIEWQAKF
ncbi:MAG: hypothetical protein ACMUIM_10105 [bacterium]